MITEKRVIPLDVSRFAITLTEYTYPGPDGDETRYSLQLREIDGYVTAYQGISKKHFDRLGGSQHPECSICRDRHQSDNRHSCE